MSHPAHYNEDFTALIAGSARLSAALEATRRLAVTAPGEPALVAVLTGPLTLAEQLSGIDRQRAKPDAQEVTILEYAGKLLLELSRQFLLAGVNLIVLLEDRMPQPHGGETWRAVVTPIANVARFHKALIAVLPLQISEENILPFLALLPKGCVACLPNSCVAPDTARLPIGVALPTDLLSWSLPEETTLQFLTTLGEMPPTTDLGKLRMACERLRGHTHEQDR